MDQVKFKGKIRLRPMRCVLLGVLICASALVLCLSTLSGYYWHKRELRGNLSDLGQAVAKRLSFTLSQPLWDFNSELVERLEEQELQSPQVIGVFVKGVGYAHPGIGKKKSFGDNDSVVVKSFEKSGVPDDLLSLSRHTEKIVYDGQEIGEVQVVVSDYFMRDKMYRHLMEQSVRVFIVLLLIGYVTYLGLVRFFVKPLRNFVDVAEQLAQGNLSARTELSGATELSVLGETLNRMAGQLEERIFDLEWQSSHDADTGIYNRKHLHQFLTDRIELARKSSQGVALVFIDVVNQVYQRYLWSQIR